MRVVREPGELEEALEAAAREAEAAFGDGTVFCERYVERPRHVEIQLLADTHGNVLALGERDCSVQRRHQKVLEESPSPAVDPELRAEMSEAAIAFAKGIGYASAGTAEFMLEGRDFYFLELNGRIQVEHPVTELVSGRDLIRDQIRVAEGERLSVTGTQSQGHAVEVRLYAEDPRSFLPQAGKLERLRLPSGIRVDAGVAEGDEIGIGYDPMIAKLIAHGPTRAEALARLGDALAETEVARRHDEPSLPPLARGAPRPPGRRGDNRLSHRVPPALGAAAAPAGRRLARRLAAQPRTGCARSSA